MDESPTVSCDYHVSFFFITHKPCIFQFLFDGFGYIIYTCLCQWIVKSNRCCLPLADASKLVKSEIHLHVPNNLEEPKPILASSIAKQMHLFLWLMLFLLENWLWLLEVLLSWVLILSYRKSRCIYFKAFVCIVDKIKKRF